MNIETVDKIKMEALKSLAETNIKVSAVKDTLAKLKTEEDVYLKSREKKVLAQIEALVTESREVLAEAYQNYNAVHDLSKDSAEFATFLGEAYQDFQTLQATFETSTEVWKNNVKETQGELEELKKQIKADRTQVDTDKKAIEKAYKVLATDKRRINDDRETLERAIIRLKEKRV